MGFVLGLLLFCGTGADVFSSESEGGWRDFWVGLLVVGFVGFLLAVSAPAIGGLTSLGGLAGEALACVILPFRGHWGTVEGDAIGCLLFASLVGVAAWEQERRDKTSPERRWAPSRGSRAFRQVRGAIGARLLDLVATRESRRAIAVTLVVVVAGGWWLHSRPSHSVPKADVALAVAQANWQGYCHDRLDYGGQWPCVEVTHIDLEPSVPVKLRANTALQEPGGKGYCFAITFVVETTPWDRSQGIPADPRTYADPGATATQCATFGRVDGDPSMPSSWGIEFAQGTWYSKWLDADYAALCGGDKCIDYN